MCMLNKRCPSGFIIHEIGDDDNAFPVAKVINLFDKILYSVNVLTHMIIPGSWILSYTLPERDV